MVQLDLKQATKMVNRSFEKWGLPRKIKIDNGRPFVNPHSRDVPTLAQLWWIGLGIEVIQNNPGCPQENGAVEGLQGILFRWSCPKSYHDLDSFQSAVDEAGRIQREVFQIAAQQYKTRMSLFPELNNNPRTYTKDQFEFSRIEEYLAKRVWKRKVKTNGEIRFMGQAIYIGNKHKAKQVSLSFDIQDKAWSVHDDRGTLIKYFQKQIISMQTLREFIHEL